MRMCAAIWIAISLLSPPAFGASCRNVEYEDVPFTVCEADPATEDIRLFLNDSNGKLLGTFDNVENAVAPRRLSWAMNAGMYHPDRRPVGLYVENGQESARLITREGPGNFGLLPNGVLCLEIGKAKIVESREFSKNPPNCRFATQSGPMLVINGALHPRFLANSDSLNIRNGVGISATGVLLAAISNQPVNFHHFARFFRDILDTPNALFLDGRISRLFAPNVDRNDLGFPMGPILGVVD